MLVTSVRTAVGLVLLASAAAGASRQPAAILESVRQELGGAAPGILRIQAAGSAYAPPAADLQTRRHFRIERYTQEVDLQAPSMTERIVRLEVSPDAGAGTPRTETRTARTDSRWADQYGLWIEPYGFLSGATSRPATVTADTLFGTTYHVVTFSAGGPPVRGYITHKNILERTRTTFDDPALGSVQFEAVYLNWTDFGGVKYPGIVIHKENDQLARILIVDKVEAGGAASPGAP
jgi:hypothetical protein